MQATWLQQWMFGERRYLARIGHRYLSVHVLADAHRPYVTYDASLREALLGWLEICQSVYADVRSQPVERVAFGYVNQFSFGQEGFDLSRVVHLQLGIGVPSAARGMTNLHVDVEFEHAGSGAAVGLSVAAEPVQDAVLLKTRVVAMQPGMELSFNEPKAIEDSVRSMKRVAKQVFFEFVTEAIHHEMGVHHVAHG